jgi:hypothetical protein
MAIQRVGGGVPAAPTSAPARAPSTRTSGSSGPADSFDDTGSTGASGPAGVAGSSASAGTGASGDANVDPPIDSLQKANQVLFHYLCTRQSGPDAQLDDSGRPKSIFSKVCADDDTFGKDELDKAANDDSLPEDLRQACAWLRDHPDDLDQLHRVGYCQDEGRASSKDVGGWLIEERVSERVFERMMESARRKKDD